MLSIGLRVSLVILASFFLTSIRGSTQAEVKFSKRMSIVRIIKVTNMQVKVKYENM